MTNFINPAQNLVVSVFPVNCGKKAFYTHVELAAAPHVAHYEEAFSL